MLIKTFGNNEKPTVLLIHGGGLSWWSWKPVINLLEKDYAIEAVVIDGHGEAALSEFISIEDMAQKIIQHVKQVHQGQVHAICGLSIGAQITVEALSCEPNLAEHWVIESALVKPMGKLVEWMEPMMGLMYPLVKQRWYAKLQAKSLCIREEDFEDYFADSCKMSLQSLKAITASNGNYKLKQERIETTAKVDIFVGSKEPKMMVESAKMLEKAIPGSRLKVLDGYKHGEFSLLHPGAFASVING